MDKKLAVKILSIIALALVVFGLVYVVQKKKSEKKGTITEEFSPPPLLEQRRVFKISEVAKNFFKGHETNPEESSKETVIYVPSGVTPNLVGIKKAEVGYFLELFKYREVAEGVIAHSFNITATDPHKEFAIPATGMRKTVGGTITSLGKNYFYINSFVPGEGKSKQYQIKISPDTTFVFISLAPNKQERKSKVSFVSIKENQNVAVFYSKENEDAIIAENVEIVSETRFSGK